MAQSIQESPSQTRHVRRGCPESPRTPPIPVRPSGVTAKRLNEQVSRNGRHFPADFMFQLTRDEAEAARRARSQFATLKQGQNIKHLPYAFTEYGAIQAANVVRSPAAELMGIAVVRAFGRLRQLLVNHKVLAAKLAELDR
jgi:hypothetical protein